MNNLFRLVPLVAFALCAAAAAQAPDPMYGCKGPLAEKQLAELRERLVRGPFHPEQAKYDVARYTVDLDVDVDAQRLAGTVVVEATCVDASLSVFIVDLREGMAVTAVSREGAPLAFTRANDQVLTTLDRPFAPGEPLSVTFTYHGRPESGGFGASGFDTHGDPPVPIFQTLSEPSFARYWWPNKDDPGDKAEGGVEARIAVGHNLLATSNGLLVAATDEGGGRTTYHWRHTYPISSYLFYVTATNYERWTQSYTPLDGSAPIPVEHYVYPEDVTRTLATFAPVPAMMAVFADWFGEYPFLREKYGQCTWELGASMEHQTCSGITSNCIDEGCAWLFAHELAHMWWGDCMTNLDWDHLWLHEGFASYAEALWAESIGGQSAYRASMRNRDYGTRMHERLYPNPSFSTSVYQKGAWVVHMLRGVVGRETLYEIFHTFLDEHAYANATTQQLEAHCEAVAGRDLGWFFDEWVYGTHRPVYRWAWTKAHRQTGWEILLRIRQVQMEVGPFAMPIELEIQTASGSERHVVWNESADQFYTLPAAGEPLSLVFDPDSWILKYANEEPYPAQPAHILLR